MQSEERNILYNGNLTTVAGCDHSMLNRALRLGDGFFETIRVIDGIPHAWDAHWARITSCCKALSLEPMLHMDSPYFLKSICSLVASGHCANARVRITFFRQGEGAYRPQTNRLGFVAEYIPLSHGAFQVKEEGLLLGIYHDMPKHRGPLAPFKLLGSHVYIQASIWAQNHNLDDVLICNDAGSIIEASASNVFVVSHDAILTPPVSSGCIGGVMRMAVVNAALDAGIHVYESALDVGDILSASEVFLSNAVQGLSWVRSFRDKRYFHKVSDHLIRSINERHAIACEALQKISSV